MVIFDRSSQKKGFVLTDAMIAVAILTIALLPLAYSFRSDAKAFRVTYQHAVAMEIVDGELEILAAGAWHDLKEGTQILPMRAESITNLPPGEFKATRSGQTIRVEWLPRPHSGVKPVLREAVVK